MWTWPLVMPLAQVHNEHVNSFPRELDTTLEPTLVCCRPSRGCSVHSRTAHDSGADRKGTQGDGDNQDSRGSDNDASNGQCGGGDSHDAAGDNTVMCDVWCVFVCGV